MLRILGIIFLVSCARVKTINLKEQTFNQQAKIIIWFQVEGLGPQHFAMLRFDKYPRNYKTAFEGSSCFGGMWNYNSYKLRPNGYEGFLSQITGKSNIKNTCEDYSHNPIWNYIGVKDFKSGVFEIGAHPKYSLERGFKCPKGYDFIKNLTLWKMAPNKGRNKNIFNVLENKSFEKGTVYYDKSCNRKSCKGDFASSVKNVFDEFAAKESFTLFIIKDHTYARAIRLKQIVKARKILSRIEDLYLYFRTKFKKKDESLILLTSTAVKNFEMPTSGKAWTAYEKAGRNILYRHNSLMSYAFAEGAGAENFCGVFEESEVLNRIIWRPDNRKWGI